MPFVAYCVGDVGNLFNFAKNEPQTTFKQT